MKKRNVTKRALFLSFVSMFMCFTMLLGTTYAWFTDTVTSGVNQIVAGNLDIELDYYDGTEYKTVEGATELFGDANWEPGHAEVVYLRLTNKGTLALKYSAALNVFNETKGLTKGGDAIQLSKYLNYAVVEVTDPGKVYTTREDAIKAAEAKGANALWEETASAYSNNVCFTGNMEKGAAAKYFAIVVWMPTTVGNEANHNGVNVPSIDLGVGVFATQMEAEMDSFGSDYDKEAELPSSGEGVVNFPSGSAGETVEVREAGTNAKIGSFEVPAAAKDSGADSISFKMNKTATSPNITIQTGETAVTYEITATGIKAGNTAPIKAMIRIPAGLNPNTVELYHYDTAVTGAYYTPDTGYVTFETTGFSPFTVVFDAESEYEAPSTEGVAYPKATVTYASQYVNTDLPWGSYGQWSPTEGLEAKLEAAFEFKCPENLSADVRKAYENWYCDFYVSLDRALSANQIFLGGNYGDFGWVGFHNGDITLAANEEIALLGSVTNNPWTYQDVESFVGEFTCGVGDVADALDGAKFTVKLRLTNPENENEFYDVNTVTYTFGRGYSIDGTEVGLTNDADLNDPATSDWLNGLFGGN